MWLFVFFFFSQFCSSTWCCRAYCCRSPTWSSFNDVCFFGCLRSVPPGCAHGWWNRGAMSYWESFPEIFTRLLLTSCTVLLLSPMMIVLSLCCAWDIQWLSFSWNVSDLFVSVGFSDRTLVIEENRPTSLTHTVNYIVMSLVTRCWCSIFIVRSQRYSVSDGSDDDSSKKCHFPSHESVDDPGYMKNSSSVSPRMSLFLPFPRWRTWLECSPARRHRSAPCAPCLRKMKGHVLTRRRCSCGIRVGGRRWMTKRSSSPQQTLLALQTHRRLTIADADSRLCTVLPHDWFENILRLCVNKTEKSKFWRLCLSILRSCSP